MQGPFFIERKRPLKLHMEITVDGTLIRTYDGKAAGWIYNPFKPNPRVEPMSEFDLQNIFDEADFDGPFVDYQTKGNTVEFVDKEELQGKPAYKLKLANKNGDVSFFYFDPATSLLLKWKGTRKIEGKDVPWESFFHDFREVNGLKYPFLIESDAPGTNQTQRIAAEKIEVNIPLDDARFEKPEPPAPPAAPAAPAQEPAKPRPFIVRTRMTDEPGTAISRSWVSVRIAYTRGVLFPSVARCFCLWSFRSRIRVFPNIRACPS